MGPALRIPVRFRAGLLLKALLLWGLGAVFGLIAWRLLSVQALWAFRYALAAAALIPVAFCGWAGALALLDALTGRAVRVEGAIALASRSSGYSLRLPDGSFGEFLLWNPWPPLEAQRRYTLLLGLRSRVIVAAPIPTEEAPPR